MDGVRLQGDFRRLGRQIRRLEEVDRKKINRKMAEAVKSSTVLRFRSQKGPNGESWTPSKRVSQIGGKTLTDTATLRKSIHSKSDATGFTVGTNLRYAATHQFGAKNRTIKAKSRGSLRFRASDGRWVTVKKVVVTIPARPYLGINDEDIREMTEMMRDALVEE